MNSSKWVKPAMLLLPVLLGVVKRFVEFKEEKSISQGIKSTLAELENQIEQEIKKENSKLFREICLQTIILVFLIIFLLFIEKKYVSALFWLSFIFNICHIFISANEYILIFIKNKIYYENIKHMLPKKDEGAIFNKVNIFILYPLVFKEVLQVAKTKSNFLHKIFGAYSVQEIAATITVETCRKKNLVNILRKLRIKIIIFLVLLIFCFIIFFVRLMIRTRL